MLIGYGQVNHRGDIDAEAVIEPNRPDGRRGGKPRIRRCSRRVDSIRGGAHAVARTGIPGGSSANESEARTFTTGYSGVGGSMPQSLVNRACLDIQRWRAGVVLLAGARNLRANGPARKGQQTGWTAQGRIRSAAGHGRRRRWPVRLAAEISADRPACTCTVVRAGAAHRLRESIENHRKLDRRSCGRFNAVTPTTRTRGSTQPGTADEIWRPAQNRMVSWPL